MFTKLKLLLNTVFLRSGGKFSSGLSNESFPYYYKNFTRGDCSSDFKLDLYFCDYLESAKHELKFCKNKIQKCEKVK